MEKKKFNNLMLSGAAAAVLSGLFIIFGILDVIKRSEYQNVSMNKPVIIIAVLVFIAGVVMFMKGLKKNK